MTWIVRKRGSFTIGTTTLDSAVIYDDQADITWLDFVHGPGAWEVERDWAASLVVTDLETGWTSGGWQLPDFDALLGLMFRNNNMDWYYGGGGGKPYDPSPFQHLGPSQCLWSRTEEVLDSIYLNPPPPTGDRGIKEFGRNNSGLDNPYGVVPRDEPLLAVVMARGDLWTTPVPPSPPSAPTNIRIKVGG